MDSQIERLYEVFDGKRLIGYMFECPGCECAHILYTQLPNPVNKIWKFNGSLSMPSFSPSQVINFPGQQKCHYVLTNGVVCFQGDCTHNFKGKRHLLTDVNK